jgi:hypothetical protein
VQQPPRLGLFGLSSSSLRPHHQLPFHRYSLLICLFLCKQRGATLSSVAHRSIRFHVHACMHIDPVLSSVCSTYTATCLHHLSISIYLILPGWIDRYTHHVYTDTCIADAWMCKLACLTPFLSSLVCLLDRSVVQKEPAEANRESAGRLLASNKKYTRRHSHAAATLRDWTSRCDRPVVASLACLLLPSFR